LFVIKVKIDEYSWMVCFESENSDQILIYHDTMKLGSCSLSSDWGDNRGCDPIDEHERFCIDVLNAIHLKLYDKEICEVLMNQKYFNGIGNYLRAEILFRAGVSPFMKARDVFQNTKKTYSYELFNHINEKSDRGLILLYLCKALPLEVINLKLNKYGSVSEKEEFEKWLKVYGKEEYKTIKGRKIYFSDNENQIPDLYIISHQISKEKKTR